MSVTLQEMKTAAAILSPCERAELAEFLLDSLEALEPNADVLADWHATAEQRMNDVKAGKVIGIPAEEVLRTLLEPRQ